ncbi:hypothetical protein DCAR_0313637 [Daucus carota subsp. sativus]|uniref:Uncharacterized protein n=1 Tax=Daucus carota subsp. sativus TaxID=79200 RepID=A0A169WEE2_DAUCS|nr:PREDICTED: CRIB domain-containing protein RIC6-like [Daucus carota subsp. sativus]WOG94344.1 hypothetical protein DCAR_0313637 [Daucus carota subsp. sativus]
MGTKMKGLLKGLKQISNKFDNKGEEIQIGLPTDVKHVAHIGWDGPSSLESPSWMKEFKGGAAQSEPLDFSAPPAEDSEKKWVSQDSSRKKSIKSRNLPELPKSSRRQFSESPATSPTPSRDPSKSRNPRRHPRKESDESSRGNRRSKELSPDAPDQGDVPKKTRRKKPKDSSAHRSPKPKDQDNEPAVDGSSQESLPSNTVSDPFSEPGSVDIDSKPMAAGAELLPASKLQSFVPEVQKPNVEVA